MKQSSKLTFEIVMYILLTVSLLSSLSFVLLNLDIDESKLCLKILGVSSILNIFIWFIYQIKTAPQIEDHE